MSGGNWHNHSSRRKCRKTWLHTKRMEKYKKHLSTFKKAFPTFIYHSPNNLEPFNPIQEVEDVACNGTTKEKHEEETQNLRGRQDI